MSDSTILSLKEKKELFQRLKANSDTDVITPCQRTDNLPVSYIQEQMINVVLAGFYDPTEMRLEGPAFSYLVKGAVNVPALDKAFCEIVRRHEVLRTNYKVVDTKIFQNINDAPNSILQVFDLRKLSPDAREKEKERILNKISTDSFSFFDSKLMISATLITSGDNDHILAVFTHHIATDGLSMMIFQTELFLLYQAFFFNTPSPLPELPIQYADFVVWERKNYTRESIEKKLAYWRNILGKINTFLPVDSLPTAFSYVGDTVPVSLLPELVKQLLLLARNGNVTLFTVLFSAYTALIHAFSGYKHNFFSIPVANRVRKETHSIIGCFTNPQYIHVDLDGNPTFMELVERVNKTLLDVYDNYVPFPFITEVIIPQGSIAGFQLHTSLDLVKPPASTNDAHSTGNDAPQSTPPEKPMSAVKAKSTAGSLALLPFNVQQPAFAIFPIDVYLSGTANSVSGRFRYQTGLYERSTILKMANDYVILLTKLVRNPNMRIQEMGIKSHPNVKTD